MALGNSAQNYFNDFEVALWERGENSAFAIFNVPSQQAGRFKSADPDSFTILNE